MIRPITLSIFFPAYNEEENIRATIARTLAVVEQSPYVSDFEIIVVNDGSRDSTGDIARQIAREPTCARD